MGVFVGVGQTLEPVSADKHNSHVSYSVSAEYVYDAVGLPKPTVAHVLNPESVST